MRRHTATPGTLTFRCGQTTRTVSVTTAINAPPSPTRRCISISRMRPEDRRSATAGASVRSTTGSMLMAGAAAALSCASSEMNSGRTPAAVGTARSMEYLCAE
jgi:hypothetical protein